MFPEVLETDDLLLRLITPADVPALFAFVSLPAVIEPTSSEGWTLASLEDFARQNVAGAAEGKWCRWGILPKGLSAPIGSIGMFNIDPHNRRAEIGYDLSPDWWGQGVMVKAATRLLDWLFKEGEFNRIEATVKDGNERSARTLERLGFEREGSLRQYKRVRGTFCDYNLWSLLNEDRQHLRNS